MKTNCLSKIVLSFLLTFVVSCNPFENKVEITTESDKPTVDNFDVERARIINQMYAAQYARQIPVTTNTSNPNTKIVQYYSSQGVLRLTPAINARVIRAQVVHTRNGYLPAFDVSGTKGVGVANGFQWINYGKNESGIYNAGQPLSAFPNGKLGGAVWLVTGDRNPPFAADGNLVVYE